MRKAWKQAEMHLIRDMWFKKIEFFKDLSIQRQTRKKTGIPLSITEKLLVGDAKKTEHSFSAFLGGSSTYFQ